jgi:hypothetical protein
MSKRLLLSLMWAQIPLSRFINYNCRVVVGGGGCEQAKDTLSIDLELIFSVGEDECHSPFVNSPGDEPLSGHLDCLQGLRDPKVDFHTSDEFNLPIIIHDSESPK